MIYRSDQFSYDQTETLFARTARRGCVMIPPNKMFASPAMRAMGAQCKSSSKCGEILKSSEERSMMKQSVTIKLTLLFFRTYKKRGGVPNIVTSSVSYCAPMTPLDCSGCPCAAGAPHTIEGSPCPYLGSTEGRTGRLWTHHSPVGGEAGMQCRKSCSVLSLCLRLKTVKWRHFVLIDFSRSLPSGVTIDEQKR